jgi:hypothetical protein
MRSSLEYLARMGETMDTFTFEGLQILIFLIPGFISQRILDILIVRRERSELGKVIEALIFTMVVYTLYSFVSGVSPVSLTRVNETLTYSYDSTGFIWLVVLCIIIPILMGLLFTTDVHMRLLRSLRATRKTSRSSVWYDVFCDIKRRVVITFGDERRMFGWPEYHSNDPENQYLFLSHAKWINDEAGEDEAPYIDIPGEGILITPELKIESIQFLEKENT